MFHQISFYNNKEKLEERLANKMNPIYKKIPTASKKYGNFLIGGGLPSPSHLEMAHFASIALNFGVGTSRSSSTGIPQDGRTSILRTWLMERWQSKQKSGIVGIKEIKISQFFSFIFLLVPIWVQTKLPSLQSQLSFRLGRRLQYQNDVLLLCKFQGCRNHQN